MYEEDEKELGLVLRKETGDKMSQIKASRMWMSFDAKLVAEASEFEIAGKYLGGCWVGTYSGGSLVDAFICVSRLDNEPPPFVTWLFSPSLLASSLEDLELNRELSLPSIDVFHIPAENLLPPQLCREIASTSNQSYAADVRMPGSHLYTKLPYQEEITRMFLVTRGSRKLLGSTCNHD